jgi:hypothetical protein
MRPSRVCPNLVLDRVQWDSSSGADLRNGSPKRGWDGVLRVSQPSRTPDTSHINDTRPNAETGHRHSPYQRSAGGIFSRHGLTSSRTRIERDDCRRHVTPT